MKKCSWIAWLGLVAVPASAADAGVPNPKPVSDAKLVEFVERQAVAWLPASHEKRIDEIGWAPSLVAAKELARRSQRPVFVFTHDGRVSTGRC
ncbi:MAG: hypothetical protein HYR60_31460 [Acidobacteria bacterium]|nr:hypothetical protein [Acidobacteriota bacterium]